MSAEKERFMVRAKFRCATKTERQGWGKDADGVSRVRREIDVRFAVVCDGSAENKAFFASSPNGEIVIGCANLAAADAFAVGAEYYVDFTPAAASTPV